MTSIRSAQIPKLDTLKKAEDNMEGMVSNHSDGYLHILCIVWGVNKGKHENIEIYLIFLV